MEISNESFLQNIINKHYNMNLTLRFLNNFFKSKVCPLWLFLSKTDFPEADLLNLLGHKIHLNEILKFRPIDLDALAKKIWISLQTLGIKGIITKFELNNKHLKKLIKYLEILDFSDNKIVYDDLIPESENSDDEEDDYIRISNIIIYLQHVKDSFKHLKLNNNLLCDDCLKQLIPELLNHDQLRKLNLKNNQLTDYGIILLLPLVTTGHLIQINICKNIGPSKDVLSFLRMHPTKIIT